jgi:hypothetical protein
MKIAGVRSFWSVVVFAMVVGALLPIGSPAQSKPGAAAPAFNLYKEISDKKNTILWRNAPATALPADVCRILNVCNAPAKMIAIVGNDKGQKIGRGLYWIPNKTGDALILQRQAPGEIQFFLLAPDGNVQKVAYIDLNKPVKQWVPMAASLVKAPFEQERKVWHDHILKAGAAAAPAPQGS